MLFHGSSGVNRKCHRSSAHVGCVQQLVVMAMGYARHNHSGLYPCKFSTKVHRSIYRCIRRHVLIGWLALPCCIAESHCLQACEPHELLSTELPCYPPIHFMVWQTRIIPKCGMRRTLRHTQIGQGLFRKPCWVAWTTAQETSRWVQSVPGGTFGVATARPQATFRQEEHRALTAQHAECPNACSTTRLFALWLAWGAGYILKPLFPLGRCGCKPWHPASTSLPTRMRQKNGSWCCR